MTAEAQRASEHDLVSLYADRVKARYRRPAPGARQRPTTGPVMRFGRRPPPSRSRSSSHSRRAVTTIVATAIAATSAGAAASSSTSNSYSIQPGDTLTAIAQQHDMSIDELIEINGLDDPDSIMAGDELLLDSPSGVRVGDTVYQIREGDTLYGIAAGHDVSLQDLLDLNELDQDDVIFAGDTLLVPTGDRESSGPGDEQQGAVYEVQTGDTLSSIARAHGISLSDLITANTIENQDVIHPGDSLTIPADEQAGLDDDETSSVESGSEVDTQAGASDSLDDFIVSLHLVARGESLGSIANRYGVTVELLALANDIRDYDRINAGDLLRIPDPSWSPAGGPELQQEGETMLSGIPAVHQALPLSSGPAAAEIATAYWGYPVSEWVFIENLPEHENPHRGFRGDINAEPGGTDNYGVYAGPLREILANYGYVGDEFYTMGDPEELKLRLDDGQPVIVWMTADATAQERFYEWHDGERFTLAPGQQAVVAYGYDDERVYVADPATAEYRSYAWDDFTRAWSTFDGMSLAVYPKS